MTAIACTAAVSAVAPVMAQTTTGSITIGATTAKSCTAPAAVTVGLGLYDGTAAVNSTANVVFKCTKTTPAIVTFVSGSTTANNGGELAGPNPATPILYSFTGNGTGVVGNGINTAAANLSVPVVITVAGDQAPAPGAYADTVAVTVSY